MAGASSVSQTAPSQILKKLGKHGPTGRGHPVSRRRVGISTNILQPGEGLQQTLVVPAGEEESLACRDGAQRMVDPEDRAEKEEEPGRHRRRRAVALLQGRILPASCLFGKLLTKL